MISGYIIFKVLQIHTCRCIKQVLQFPMIIKCGSGTHKGAGILIKNISSFYFFSSIFSLFFSLLLVYAQLFRNKTKYLVTKIKLHFHLQFWWGVACFVCLFVFYFFGVGGGWWFPRQSQHNIHIFLYFFSSTEDVVKKLRTRPFSISTDGSSDRGAREQLYPIIVRYYDEHVVSSLLEISSTKERSTGKKHFSVIGQSTERVLHPLE